MASSQHVIIDRFEDGGWAVLEVAAGTTITVPAGWLPASATSGAALRVRVQNKDNDDASTVRFVLDTEAPEQRAQRVRSKLDQLRDQ